MINYFIRPGGAYVKVDTQAEAVELVLSAPTQMTLSSIKGNKEYYDNTVSASVNWTALDETTYNTSRSEVLAILASIA